MQMSLDDYAVSCNVGFCWALRLLQVLAFTECPIDSQAEESLDQVTCTAPEVKFFNDNFRVYNTRVRSDCK